MERGIHRLSQSRIAKASARGLYADGGGLYLQVAANGSRSWLFRYARDKRARHVGLGPLHTVDVTEARERARECRRLLHSGTDPLSHKRASEAAAKLEAAKAKTFGECADAYIASHKAGWKNAKHAAQWRSTLDTYAKDLMAVPVQAVDTAAVLRSLDSIWRTKPETASRLRGRIEAVLSFATARQYRTGENPARWKGHLDQLLPARTKVRAVKHHPALAYDEVGAFMRDLRKREALAARALEFLILTAARTGEVIGAQWSEIDLVRCVWTVPAGRMKNEAEHRVPLSRAAVAVLEGMKLFGTDGFVFPGPKRGCGLSNMALLGVLERMGRDDLTAHGFRSTFRDWAAEVAHVANEVAEMALAHTIASKAEAAYRRGDLFEKRTKLMQQWAEYCFRGPSEDNVVSLPTAATTRS
jgi:integrase